MCVNCLIKTTLDRKYTKFLFLIWNSREINVSVNAHISNNYSVLLNKTNSVLKSLDSITKYMWIASLLPTMPMQYYISRKSWVFSVMNRKNMNKSNLQKNIVRQSDFCSQILTLVGRILGKLSSWSRDNGNKFSTFVHFFTFQTVNIFIHDLKCCKRLSKIVILMV
jgi:hypothetical protein